MNIQQRNVRKAWYFTVVVSVLPVLAYLSGCDRQHGIYEDRLDVLGTFAQITIDGMPEQLAREAALAVEQDLESLDHIGHGFEENSELQRLNAAFAQGRSMEVSDGLLELVLDAKMLYAKSGGLFDPARGELNAFWEFTCDRDACSESPYPVEVQRLVDEETGRIIARGPTMDDVIVSGSAVRSNNALVKLEFGYMLLGLALDKGVEHLKALGVENAEINIGGSARTTGMRGKHHWWIGIPDTSGIHMLGSIENIEDQSVVTVRAFDRSFGKQGPVYRHIVDPRTGKPVRDIESVTVMHENAMIANAFAVIMQIAGIGDWKAPADAMGVDKILVIAADGTVYTSPAMESIVHWNQGVTRQSLEP